MSEHERAISVHGSPTRCPYCHEHCSPDEANVVCNRCLARHHSECWREGGDKCAGCAGTAVPAHAVLVSPPPAASLLHLPAEVRTWLEGELAPREQVVWVGQRLASSAASAVLPIALVGALLLTFGGFVLVVCCGLAWLTGDPGFLGGLCVSGMPCTLGGIAVAMPLLARKQAARSCYAVTDRRALILEMGIMGGRTTHFYAPDRLRSFARVEQNDGSGDLVFEQVQVGRRASARGFLGIRNVREVEATIRRTFEGK